MPSLLLKTSIGPSRSSASVLSRPIQRASLLRMPASGGWHSHREVQWIAAGEGVASLRTKEAEWLALPGQALLVATSVGHDLSLWGAMPAASLYFDPDALTWEGEDRCRLLAVSPLMDAAAHALIEAASRDGAVDALRDASLCSVILDELDKPGLRPFRLPIPSATGLRELCLELMQRPNDPRDLDACADAVGMSRRTFTRRFRLETGESFLEWKQRLRVMHALKLRAGGEPAKRVASEAGYRSVQALHAEAKKHLGIRINEALRA